MGYFTQVTKGLEVKGSGFIIVIDLGLEQHWVTANKFV